MPTFDNISVDVPVSLLLFFAFIFALPIQIHIHKFYIIRFTALVAPPIKAQPPMPTTMEPMTTKASLDGGIQGGGNFWMQSTIKLELGMERRGGTCAIDKHQ
jgi:hypothetical protein